MNNLNEIYPENDGNWPDEKLGDNSIRNIESNVSIFFRKQKEVLTEKIRQYPCIVGCIAWLTDFDILNELSKIETVSIIVQKEDFLRLDLNGGNDFKIKLRTAYNALKNNIERHGWPGLLSRLSVTRDPSIEPVRCVGNHNREKKPAFPRMHNKFLVFCDKETKRLSEVYSVKINPQEVWTGSFNLTQNASNSLENAILISNSQIAEKYFQEFSQIFSLSEPLDWENEWCEPQFRIGT